VTMFPKPGIVRLKGKELDALRVACFLRDGGRCTKCRCQVSLHWKYSSSTLPPMHMAHIRNKRNHGDVITNVTTRCPAHHLIDMHNPKPCPPKQLNAVQPNRG
jgi:hypothetical protein